MREKKLAVVCIGRFAPPTKGHSLVFSMVNDLAKKLNADGWIFTTTSYWKTNKASNAEDRRRNPIPFEFKVSTLNKIVKEHNWSIQVYDEKDASSPVLAAKKLYEMGYTGVKFIAGSDRIKGEDEYESLVKSYNGKEYDLDPITFEKAGDRVSAAASDADFIKTISGTELRQCVLNSDFESFSKMIDSHNEDLKLKLFGIIKTNFDEIQQIDTDKVNIKKARDDAKAQKRADIDSRKAARMLKFESMLIEEEKILKSELYKGIADEDEEHGDTFLNYIKKARDLHDMETDVATDHLTKVDPEYYSKIQNFFDSESEPQAEFDLIESVVEELALLHDLDSDCLWEEFEQFSDEELLEYAVDAKGYKSSTGGLTQKGRDHYNKQSGGHVQAPVTTPPSKLKPGSKAAKRRKSFCARMGGVKGPMKKPNGEPSRKALALKKWNC